MRPFSIPQKLKPLTEPQFTQLHTWLDDLPYKQVRERLLVEFGIDMSDSALCRYNQTRDLACHTAEHNEGSEQVRDFLAIMNGQPVPYSEAGIELVMKRAFDLLTAREMAPARLATLLKVFHYRKNCQWNERRHAQNERRLAQADIRNEISHRLATVREQELALKKSKPPGSSPTDHWKPWSLEELPVRQAEVEARIQADPFLRQIGLPPRDFPFEPEDPTSTPTVTPNLEADPFLSQIGLPPENAPAPDRGPSPDRSVCDESSARSLHELREPPDQKCQMKNAHLVSRSEQQDLGTKLEAGLGTPCSMLNEKIISHALRRWRAHIPRPEETPEPDDSWRDECPCGKPLPCPDHPDLYFHLRSYRPQHPDFALMLKEAGIPYYIPTAQELGCSRETLAKSRDLFALNPRAPSFSVPPDSPSSPDP